MSAVLLVWNPTQYPWEELPTVVTNTASGHSQPITWSTGVRRILPIGSRVFLMHLGREPKGIVSSGVTTRDPALARHWDAQKAADGQETWYTEFVPELLLDPRTRPPMDPRRSASAAVRAFNWTPQASGIAIPDEVATALLEEWHNFVDGRLTSLGEADEDLGALEGEERQRLIRHRSRERALRAAKFAEVRSRNHGRLCCEVPGCGFDFLARYGERGRDFAEVHHVNPLAESGIVRTSLSDLRVVCANCHRMIHRQHPMAALESLLPGSGVGV